MVQQSNRNAQSPKLVLVRTLVATLSLTVDDRNRLLGSAVGGRVHYETGSLEGNAITNR